MLACTPGNTPSKKQGWIPNSIADFKRFPFDNFTYCLTLFPKCFSSFPHGTCSLSVSPQYLALDGIYHPFWAAFPNNSTRGECITKHWLPRQVRDSHPLRRPIPRDLYAVQHGKHFSRLQRGPKRPAFKFELIPLHSPLLGESLLVSLPPLIDMLKFSG